MRVRASFMFLGGGPIRGGISFVFLWPGVASSRSVCALCGTLTTSLWRGTATSVAAQGMATQIGKLIATEQSHASGNLALPCERIWNSSACRRFVLIHYCFANRKKLASLR